MKILFIGSIAAVPQTLVASLRKRNIKVNQICRKEENIFSVELFVPDAKIISGRARNYILKALLYARKFDVIHIHSLDLIIPLLRLLYPKKKIVLTYHGTDIRSQWEKKKKYWKKANVVTVSTIDLLDDAPEGVVYLPNPVDLEHFKRYNPVLKNSALFTYYDRFEKNRDMPLEIAKKEAKERNLTLIVIERDKWGRFQYPLFPRFLELFDYYIDARISHSGALIHSLSLTALQALALNVKVIYLGEEISQLPMEHEVNNVVDSLLEIYSSLLQKK